MNDRFGEVARGAVAASEGRRWPESRLFEGKPPINMRLQASDDGCKLPQPIGRASASYTHCYTIILGGINKIMFYMYKICVSTLLGCLSVRHNHSQHSSKGLEHGLLRFYKALARPSARHGTCA